MLATFDRTAWRFFQRECGAVGNAATVAAALARAEAQMRLRDWAIGWQDDPEPWEGDAGERPAQVETAVLYYQPVDDEGWPVGDPIVLASLGGIGDPSPACRRLIAAELAWEALERDVE